MKNLAVEKKDAYRLLRNLNLSRMATETTKRAIVARLIPILENEERRYRDWQEGNKHRLNATRAATVERRFIKRIQAMKIVIHMLDRDRMWSDDEPSFIVKRKK